MTYTEERIRNRLESHWPDLGSGWWSWELAAQDLLKLLDEERLRHFDAQARTWAQCYAEALQRLAKEKAANELLRVELDSWQKRASAVESGEVVRSLAADNKRLRQVAQRARNLTYVSPSSISYSMLERLRTALKDYDELLERKA